MVEGSRQALDVWRRFQPGCLLQQALKLPALDHKGVSAREQLDLLHNFKNRMSAYPEVTQCYYVTGSADFILVVNAGSMEEYGAFTERAFFPDKNVKSFSTYVSMQTIKFTTRINLDVS
ncbi:Lrp/AsnC ligand binding domain-containing protein [Bradyrhizobium sp. STM 3561]|uniref:Lrp/AsnC ligand binding domain-containing protein n=1 Tax=unclassified Bradyrhizobium TaxID=2631580 RepID=UPI00388E5122